MNDGVRALKVMAIAALMFITSAVNAAPFENLSKDTFTIILAQGKRPPPVKPPPKKPPKQKTSKIKKKTAPKVAKKKLAHSSLQQRLQQRTAMSKIAPRMGPIKQTDEVRKTQHILTNSVKGAKGLLNGTSVKRLEKYLISRGDKKPITRAEHKKIRDMVRRLGGNIRYDFTPKKGKRGPHLQVEGLGRVAESRHMLVDARTVRAVNRSRSIAILKKRNREGHQ